MKTTMLNVTLVVLSLYSALTLLGQTAVPGLVSAPDPDPGMTAYAQGLFIPFIPGRPFRARVEVEITRQLPDGSTVAQKYYNDEARDSAGRGYRETRNPVPLNSDLEPPLVQTRVYDTVASLITICQPALRVCQQIADPATAPEVDPVGRSKDGESVLARQDLGTRTMDGLKVLGTRETRTFAPGAIGNDKPMVATKEIWYSPQLQFNLMVTRVDPRTGTQKLAVTELKLGEPAPEWFAIPDGYQLVAERTMNARSTYPAQLEPLIEKDVSGMTPDELRTALAPVEAAISTYAKAHAEASPNDNNNANFAGQLRNQLFGNLHALQQSTFPQRVPSAQSEERLNQVYQQVVTSPCLNKPAPGDPPDTPKDEASLREEERAWVAFRDAWIAFLEKLYPHVDAGSFVWLPNNQRILELQRMLTTERNRGCNPEDSMESLLAGLVKGMTAEQLTVAAKPLNAALDAYAKAHAESAPNDSIENFMRQQRQTLVNDLRMQERDRIPTREQFEEADLHLNQVYRAVIASPCVGKPIPGDPPNAPVSREKLRAEERSWIGVRDAWIAFLATIFPNAHHAGFGAMLTEQRANDLREMENVEQNRGCEGQE